MRYFSVFVLFLMAGFFLFPSYAFAQTCLEGYKYDPALKACVKDVPNVCPAGFENLCKITPDKWMIVGNIVSVLIIIAIVVSIIFIIWGGIKWITSNGDKGKVMEARGVVVSAIVGLIITLLSYTIIMTILGVFTPSGHAIGESFLKIPKLTDPIK